MSKGQLLVTTVLFLILGLTVTNSVAIPQQNYSISSDSSVGIEFSTYLGGSSYDFGDAVAIDSHGNIFIAGSVWSDDFPVTNAIQPDYVEYDV